MTKVTIVGGSLGAGKTTLMTNLLKNEGLSQKDGIIVMDAAGDIDYSRLAHLAQQRGVQVANATSACTVCDGPQSAFVQLNRMEGLDRVILELSGQMPLSVMMSKLESKGVKEITSVYLVDPKHFTLVQAADEVPFADVVGITKRDSELDLSALNPYAKVLRIQREGAYTIDGLFSGVNSGQRQQTKKVKAHKHCENGMISKWSGKVHNPYYDSQELEEILSPMAEQFHRVKGYVALDAQEVFSFDGVQGKLEWRIRSDPTLGNGTLLIANGQDKYFHEKEVLELAAPLVEKPESSPVLRRGSEREVFDEYIALAMKAKQYDDAMGAAEQYAFEHNDTSLVSHVLPEFSRGKLALIQSGNLDKSQRVLQAMSTLYHLVEEPNAAHDTFVTLSQIYRDDVDSMTTQDWEGIKSSSDPEGNKEYIKKIRARV